MTLCAIICSNRVQRRKAVKHQYRISETTLLGLALIGGSAGALAGMHLFHHKTRKLLFRAIPVLLAVQTAVLFLLSYSG